MHQFEPAMQQALAIALRGPYQGVNPQVGCVILDSNLRLIAEGWHLGAGTPHAEVMAINGAFATLGTEKLPEGCTAVVTLEPCNHTGRTGPCSQALLDAGVSRVVYAVADPGEASSGGAAKLQAAGVEVVSGVLAKVAEDQNRVWLTANRLGRPFVTLKWASSLDGRAAAEDGSSKWISGPESRADSHLRRSRVDAILVGTGTAEADDPELTARKPDGSLYEHQPLRVILGERELPPTLRVFNDQAETLLLRTHSIRGALAQLWQRGIKQVWVEGGPRVASKFVQLGLVDEILVYLAPMLLGGDNTALRNIGVTSMPQARQLEIREQLMLGKDIFLRSNPIQDLKEDR